MLKAYFSHPSLSYHTNTEEIAINMIKKALKVDNIINPYDYGRNEKEKLNNHFKDSDIVVGMSIFDKYPFIVWNDLEYGLSLDKKVYTFKFQSDENDPFVLEEGIDGRLSKLSSEETDDLYKKIMKQDNKNFLSTLFFGKLGKRSVF